MGSCNIQVLNPFERTAIKEMPTAATTLNITKQELEKTISDLMRFTRTSRGSMNVHVTRISTDFER